MNRWSQHLIALADANGWIVIEMTVAESRGRRDGHGIHIILEDPTGNQLRVSGNMGIDLERYLRHLTIPRRKIKIENTGPGLEAAT